MLVILISTAINLDLNFSWLVHDFFFQNQLREFHKKRLAICRAESILEVFVCFLENWNILQVFKIFISAI